MDANRRTQLKARAAKWMTAALMALTAGLGAPTPATAETRMRARSGEPAAPAGRTAPAGRAGAAGISEGGDFRVEIVQRRRRRCTRTVRRWVPGRRIVRASGRIVRRPGHYARVRVRVPCRVF